MKSMSDKKMDMKPAKPHSAEFFPEESHAKVLGRAGEIKGFKYPDTEELALRDQKEFVSNTSKNMPKTGFRH